MPARTLLILLVSSQSLVAQEWTRFRGPNGSGTSAAKTIPTEWTADSINWSIDLPGRGNGSPVLWGTKLFVVAEENDGATRLLTCVDSTDGKQLWTRTYDVGTHKKHRQNSYASCTPACDADNVYVAWGTPERINLVALTHAGEEVWQRDLGAFQGGHGHAVSPMVYEDLVVIGHVHGGESSLIAVDRKTGETRWTVPRPKASRATYSTPCVYAPPGHDPVLVFTNWMHGITAVDPRNGSVVWELSVFDTTRNERAIGSPFVAGDLVVGSCGFTTAQKHLVAVRPTETGAEEVFRIERNVPHVPTSLYHEGRLYLWGDKGIIACHDATDGSLVWQGRVGGNVFGSPVCVDGRLFCVDSDGVVVVVGTGEEFEELARYDLGDGSHATPAVANGTMFVRTHAKLFSIGGRSPSTEPSE